MAEQPIPSRIQIEPWTDADLGLLRRINIPAMKSRLGGVETEERLLARQKRYVALGAAGPGRMFRIVLLPELEAVGSVGYWERVWLGATVYEMGWSVLPQFQSKGIASAAAAAALASARAERRHRYLHAFPSTGNPASNAICKKLGFLLIAECDFEYPKGRFMRSNNWRLDLGSPNAF